MASASLTGYSFLFSLILIYCWIISFSKVEYGGLSGRACHGKGSCIGRKIKCDNKLGLAVPGSVFIVNVEDVGNFGLFGIVKRPTTMRIEIF